MKSSLCFGQAIFAFFLLCAAPVETKSVSASPKEYTVEVLFLADKEAVNTYRGFGYTEQRAREVLVSEMEYYVKEINEMYKALSDIISIRILPRLIRVLQEDIVKPEDVTNGNQVTEFIFERFESWLDANNYSAKYDFDMALLYTGYNLFVDGSPRQNVGGFVTDIGVACKVVGNFAVVEIGGHFFTVIAAAHEIAHALGADHDDGTACAGKPFNLMSTKRSQFVPAGRRFSTCNAQDMKTFIEKMGPTSCLLRTSPESEAFKEPTVAPTDFTTRESLCQRFGGPQIVVCGFDQKECTTTSCCRKSPYSSSYGNYIGSIEVPDGTSCGASGVGSSPLVLVVII